MSDYWVPTAMERTCLAQLDRSENWKMLNRPRPEETEVLSWKPFYRIFGFNLVLFSIVLGVLLSLIALGSGFDRVDLWESAPIGLTVVLAIASALAFYVTNLYRRVWNRRARSLGG